MDAADLGDRHRRRAPGLTDEIGNRQNRQNQGAASPLAVLDAVSKENNSEEELSVIRSRSVALGRKPMDLGAVRATDSDAWRSAATFSQSTPSQISFPINAVSSGRRMH